MVKLEISLSLGERVGGTQGRCQIREEVQSKKPSKDNGR